MATKRLKCILKLFIAVFSGEQVWPISLLFIETSPVKQYIKMILAAYLMLCVKVFSCYLSVQEYAPDICTAVYIFQPRLTCRPSDPGHTMYMDITGDMTRDELICPGNGIPVSCTYYGPGQYVQREIHIIKKRKQPQFFQVN